MSEKIKKSSGEKKPVPSILKSSSKNNNSNSKPEKDNLTMSLKHKKAQSININNLTKSKEKIKLKKKSDDDISFHFSFKKGKFLSEPKILNNFLSFFNIRELFIIMEIDTHIHKAITESEVFQNYLTIRSDFILKHKNKKITKATTNLSKKNTNIHKYKKIM